MGMSMIWNCNYCGHFNCFLPIIRYKETHTHTRWVNSTNVCSSTYTLYKGYIQKRNYQEFIHKNRTRQLNHLFLFFFNYSHNLGNWVQNTDCKLSRSWIYEVMWLTLFSYHSCLLLLNFHLVWLNRHLYCYKVSASRS